MCCSYGKLLKRGRYFLAILLLLSIPALAFCQSLTIRMNDVSAAGDSVRGMVSGFPFPVITRHISIIDSSTGAPALGLADSSRWLGANETARNGRTVKENWQVLQEYAVDDSIRANLYAQPDGPLLREVTRFSFPIISTSTMLVMDVSTSIDTVVELNLAKKGANRFVDGMRVGSPLITDEYDRAGVIEFRRKTATVLSNFTDNRSDLHRAINSAKPIGRSGTPLYLALKQAIKLTSKEDPNRIRSVIVYTDGLNNRSGSTIEQVIDAAKESRIPIHTIYLRRKGVITPSDKAAADSLRFIAEATNGFFFTTIGGVEFERIYENLSKVTQNFYLMAHHSADVCVRAPERFVEVTAKTADGRIGVGAGRYTAPGQAKFYDLRLTASATQRVLAVGDTIDFTIRVENVGPDLASAVSVQQVLPHDTLRFVLDSGVSGSPQISVTGDSLNWSGLVVPSGATISLRFAAVVSPQLTLGEAAKVVTSASVVAACEQNVDDNTVFLPFEIIAKPPVYDLELTNIAFPEAVLQNEEFRFELTMKNNGPDTAREITLVDTLFQFDLLRDSLRFDVAPDSIRGNVLFWHFDSLAPNAVQKVIYTANLPACDLLENAPAAVRNHASVLARYDTNPANNFAKASVDITPLDCSFVELAVRKTASVDSVEQGVLFTYLLEISNQGSRIAREVNVWDALPTRLRIASASVLPSTTVNSDTLQWHFDEIAAADTIQIALQAEFLCAESPTIFPFIQTNFVWLSALEDRDAGNNQDSVEVVVTGSTCATPADFKIEKRVSQDVVKQGELFRFDIDVVQRTGPDVGNVAVFDVLPDFFQLIEASPAPANGLSADTLQWQFNSAAFVDTSISLLCQVPCDVDLPTAVLEWVNVAWLSADGDTNSDNDRDSVTVTFSGTLCDSANVDFELRKSSSSQTVKQGEEFTWQIDVNRLTAAHSDPVNVFDVLPEFVEIISASLPPLNGLAADTLFWQFNGSLQDTTIELTALVPCGVAMPSASADLLNTAWIAVVNDTNFVNDRDSVTVTFSGTLCDSAKVDFELSKSSSSQSVKQGEEFTWQIDVKRLTAAHSGPVNVFDVLPEFVEIVNAGLPPLNGFTADTLFWQFNGSLQDTTIELTALVPCSVSLPSANISLLNTAWVAATNDSNLTNDRDDAVVTISAPCRSDEFDLSVEKSASQDTVFVGQEYSYRIRIHNHGPARATNITVADAIPADLLFSEFNFAPFATSEPDTLVWHFDELAPNTTIEINYNAMLPGSTELIGEPVRINTARVKTANDVNAANDQSSATVVFEALRNCKKLMLLDRNVFAPSAGDPLQIIVDVDSDNNVSLDVYDITGYPIKNIVKGRVPVGRRQTFFWDGTSDDGRNTGSGIYVILFQGQLSTGKIIECDKKVIIVR